MAYASGHTLSGKATWYGTSSTDGKLTANGERFSRNRPTAAHLTLPFGTVVRVYNLRNGSHTLVRITDRGPFGKGRVVDLSYRSAQMLRMTKVGVVPVALEVVADATGRPATEGNSFYVHLATEKETQAAHTASHRLQTDTGLPVKALFSSQGETPRFLLCAGPYETFVEAENAFLSIEKGRSVLGIIEGPTDGGVVEARVPPVRRQQQSVELSASR